MQIWDRLDDALGSYLLLSAEIFPHLCIVRGKPIGRSKPNFMCNLLGSGEHGPGHVTQD